MFYPKYDFSHGRFQSVGRRVAAVSRGHSKTKRNTRTAANVGTGYGGLNSAGGGAFQPYSPVYERAEDPTLAEEFMPTDTQTQNKIFKNLIIYDPVAGPATEYWRDLAFSRYVRLGGLEDNKMHQFYEDALEASGIVSQMKWLLDQYLVFGKFVTQMEMDERKGYWVRNVIHDLDFVEVTAPVFSGDDYLINVQPTNEQVKWALSRDPRVMERRQAYDPKLVKMMATGETYPIPAQDSIFLPRKAHATDYYGTSYLTRIIPFKIMEKALLDAETMAARRRAGPVWVISVPENYEAEEIQDIIDQFFAIEEDPIGGKVAVRGEVTVTSMGGGKGDFWTLSDEYEFIKNAKLNALGISESFLSGEASYNSMDKVVQIFVEKLRAIRYHLTEEVIVNKMLKTLARINGFVYTPKTQTAHHYRIAKRDYTDADLIIPEVEWDEPLEPQADTDYWNLLEQMQAKGIPVHMRKWAQAAGYDLDESFENAQQELEDRAKVYKIKSALAKQADKAGFDLEGQYTGGAGAIGGGGLGEGGGGFGDLGGGGETEFGPDLEGGGFDLGPAEMGTPPATPELPAPATEAPEAPAAPPSGGEGAGASLLAPRFTVEKPTKLQRYADPRYPDLERALGNVAVWNETDHLFGLPRRRVAHMVDLVAHRKPEDREGRVLSRYLKKQGLTELQSEAVQYCAARLGFMKAPTLSDTTIQHLQHHLVDLANQRGLDRQLNKEFELLTKIAKKRSRVPAAGPRNVTSLQANIPDAQILTGVLP